MYQSSKNLLNFLVVGLDSYFGPVRDIYFDDSEWTIRYLVIELSEPEMTNKYLISPLSIREINYTKKEIHVHISYDKLINSPEVDTNLPISRQNEIALRRYFEWPVYWGESEFINPPPIPGQERPFPPLFDDKAPDDEFYDSFTEEENNQLLNEPEDDELMGTEFGHSEEDFTYSNDLRSIADLFGYRIQTEEAIFSFIEDFICDDSDWIIRFLVINLGNTHTDEYVLITLHFIGDINWANSKIIVNLKQEQLIAAPRYTIGQQISKEYERQLFSFYDSI